MTQIIFLEIRRLCTPVQHCTIEDEYMSAGILRDQTTRAGAMRLIILQTGAET